MSCLTNNKIVKKVNPPTLENKHMAAEQAKHDPDKEGEGEDNDDSSPKHTPRATTNPEKAFEKSFR